MPGTALCVCAMRSTPFPYSDAFELAEQGTLCSDASLALAVPVCALCGALKPRVFGREGAVEGAKIHVADYLTTFDQYNYLWKEDKQKAYNDFLKTVPDIEAFSNELKKYMDIEREIRNIPGVHVSDCSLISGTQSRVTECGHVRRGGMIMMRRPRLTYPPTRMLLLLNIPLADCTACAVTSCPRQTYCPMHALLMSFARAMPCLVLTEPRSVLTEPRSVPQVIGCMCLDSSPLMDSLTAEAVQWKAQYARCASHHGRPSNCEMLYTS
eukprot:1277719-Rhodomonas_salina.6